MQTIIDFAYAHPVLFYTYIGFLIIVCSWYTTAIACQENFKFSNAAWAILDDLFEPKGDYLWMCICTFSIAAVSYYTNASTMETVCSITGIIGAVLVAKGNSSSYLWGFISTALYIIISYNYKLYGETIVYAWLFLPMQVIGYYYWIKNSNTESYDVIKKVMTFKQRVLLFGSTAAIIFMYAMFIKELNGSLPGLDSATSILSIVATVLMVLRYAEQWVIWMMVNVVAIVMWTKAAYNHPESAGWAVLAMWVTFLMNSVYGWYKWRKGESNAI